MLGNIERELEEAHGTIRKLKDEKALVEKELTQHLTHIEKLKIIIEDKNQREKAY
jgi:hypothetical protein